VGLWGAFWGGIVDTLSMNSSTFVVRSSLGFFLAFGLGLKGMPGILSSFNSTPAGTTAYLMASEGCGGSAVLKNIARFQGTAGGTIFGQLIRATAISCNLQGQICGALSVFIVEFFAMFLYFSSESYGYVGVLLGAYGAEHLMMDCSTGESGLDVYGVILQQFLAISSVTIADLLVGNVSSSTLAVKSYCSMTDAIGESLKDFLCLKVDASDGEDIPLVHSHRHEILAHNAAMAVQGKEAELEPRWARTPWRMDLWQHLEKSTLKIGEGMVAIEYTVSEGTSGPEARKTIMNSPSMQSVSEMFFYRAQSVFMLAEKLMMHESMATFEVPKSMMQDFLKQRAASINDKLEEILEQVNQGSEHKASGEPVATLGEDVMCAVGVVLLSMEDMMKHLNNIEDQIFTSPEFVQSKLL